jgi:hypothetical protein
VINERLRLSVGAPPAQRAFGVVFGLLFAAIGTAFVLLPFIADGFLASLTGEDDRCLFTGDMSSIPADLLRDCVARESAWDDGFGLGPIKYIGLCGIPFALLGLYMVVNVLRTAAWLDGTRAEVRGAFGTRTVDLANAAVSAGAIAYRRQQDTAHAHIERVPTIVAQDRGTGKKVTIPLRGGHGSTLPPHELRALADAMTVGRSTDGRDADVLTLAGQLRRMAENPLGL